MKVAVWGTGQYYERGIAYIEDYGHEIAEKDEKADVLICLAHPEILKRDTLSRFKHCINFHCGLPDYRGRHPLQWMLIDGVKRIPCAVHYMDEDIDTGDIIVESSFDVSRNETYATALEKVIALVGPLLVSALFHIGNDSVKRKKQPSGRYWPKRTQKDSQFSFNQPSIAVHRFVNALSDGGMPNAHCDGLTYKRSYIGEKAGRIIDTTVSGRYIVATADGIVMLERA